MAGFDPGSLPFGPPLEPMLAKTAASVPRAGGYLFEPKWDGFRTLVFKDGERLYLQSRSKKPMLRYFPELEAPLRSALPPRCVLDGELVVAQGERLDFEALSTRIHPAKSRVDELAARTPAAFVAFDLLALDGTDLRGEGQAQRRALLEGALADVAPPIHVTPMTREVAVAEEWFERFEGAGLDGVMAKGEELAYQPGKRAMLKIKHVRTADCVIAGFRWHKQGKGELLGSLLLGLYDDAGQLQHVGVTSSFTMARRKALIEELAPLRVDAPGDHPWAGWAEAAEAHPRHPGMQSRWSAGKDMSFEPLRPTRVCEVKFDHMEGRRFRHTATFLRFRDDKDPRECDFAQLEVTPPYELSEIFGQV